MSICKPTRLVLHAALQSHSTKFKLDFLRLSHQPCLPIRSIAKPAVSGAIPKLNDVWMENRNQTIPCRCGTSEYGSEAAPARGPPWPRPAGRAGAALSLLSLLPEPPLAAGSGGARTIEWRGVGGRSAAVAAGMREGCGAERRIAAWRRERPRPQVSGGKGPRPRRRRLRPHSAAGAPPCRAQPRPSLPPPSAGVVQPVCGDGRSVAGAGAPGRRGGAVPRTP